LVGKEAGGDPGLVEELVVAAGKAVPAAVDERGRVGGDPVCGGASKAGDRRTHPVGADGDPGADDETRAPLVAPNDTGHPPVPVAAHVGDGDAEAHVGAGVPGRVDQDRVEHSAARGVESVDAGAQSDRYVDSVRAVVEHTAPHRWSADGDDPIEQPPAGELQHGTAQEGVGRESVGAILAAILHQDPYPGTARTSAVAAPAGRAPTTTTSYCGLGDVLIGCAGISVCPASPPGSSGSPCSWCQVMTTVPGD
jgi:hypothetical protein